MSLTYTYSTDAARDFCKAVGIGIHSSRAEDARKMLEHEARNIETDYKRKEPYKRNKYGHSLYDACELMITWYTHASEYDLSDLPAFIASHRLGCIWCVLVARDAKIAD